MRRVVALCVIALTEVGPDVGFDLDAFDLRILKGSDNIPDMGVDLM